MKSITDIQTVKLTIEEKSTVINGSIRVNRKKAPMAKLRTNLLIRILSTVITLSGQETTNPFMEITQKKLNSFYLTVLC